MEMAVIEAQTRQFILDNFVYGGADDDIGPDTSFMANGIIDSLGVLQLISFVEEQYGIEVGDHEVLPENLDTLRNIATFVSTKLAAPASVAV